MMVPCGACAAAARARFEGGGGRGAQDNQADQAEAAHNAADDAADDEESPSAQQVAHAALDERVRLRLAGLGVAAAPRDTRGTRSAEEAMRAGVAMGSCGRRRACALGCARATDAAGLQCRGHGACPKDPQRREAGTHRQAGGGRGGSA